MDLFFDVFNLIAVIYAIATGLTFGSTFLLYLSLRIPTKVPQSTRLLATLITITCVIMGTLFFAGQIVQAYTSDPAWPRAFARLVLWEVFSVAVGAGFGISRSFAKAAQPDKPAPRRRITDPK
jgi:cytochrome c biogenesis protein CcdA